MKDQLVETIVGALALALAAAFLMYGYSVANAGLSSDDSYEVLANFDSANGLTVGSDVRLAGIKVGIVSAQRLNEENYTAALTLKLATQVRLPEDTSAKVTSDGLLGSNYISLTPGGSLVYLENRGEIMYTQGAIDLIGLIGQAVFDVKDDK